MRYPHTGLRVLGVQQGYGDMIQCIRYAPWSHARGRTVIEGYPKPLRSLLQTVEGVGQAVTSRSDLPRFDLHVPLMSLPAIFGTSLHTIPAAVPYLTPLPGEFHLESATLPGFRVGLAWAGDSAHRNDHNRSLPLDRLQLLLQVPGIQ